MVDPDHAGLYVITKLFRGYGVVYRADISSISDGVSRTLHAVGKVPIGLVTAADSGPDGIVVGSYFEARVYPWSSDRRVESTLGGKGCPIVLVVAGEAIAFEGSTGRLYAVAEGIRPPITYVAPSRDTSGR